MRRLHAGVARTSAFFVLGVIGASLPSVEVLAEKPAMAGRAGAMLAAGGSFAPMLERVVPAVVTMRVTGARQLPTALPAKKPDGSVPPLPPAETREFRSGGSGVVIDASKGLVLTNNHVIEHATRIEVVLSDGRRAIGRLVGTDIGADIAVVEINLPNLPSIAIGDSDTVRVGDIVAAVGNPFGLEGTATVGIVSAVMRTEVGHGVFEDFLQIDASVNPGNSGGALADVHGALIGINTAAGGGQGQNVGIGFAVPINMALVIAKELVEAGRMRRGSVGLDVVDLPDELAMQPDGSATRGALVSKVASGSPAAEAGIVPGDIVVAAAGKPVRSAAEFVTRTVTVPIGTEVALVLFSKGQGRLVGLTTTDLAITPPTRRLAAAAGALGGASIADIAVGHHLFGSLRGVSIEAVAAGSASDAAGLHVGDAIVAIDEAPTRTGDELIYRLRAAGAAATVSIIRDGRPFTLPLERP
jgi:serine protease DegQ